MARLEMSPHTGHRTVRHAGDFITFRLRHLDGPVPDGWQARLRTNIGRAGRIREEIVHSHFQKLPLAGSAWRDLPMSPDGDGGWSITLPLTEVGFFKAKAYAIDARGSQHWPDGPDVGIGVHPSWTRSANTIYCAFPRMFGSWSKTRLTTREDHQTPDLKALDDAGFTVIPPSGTLRDLIAELPHILDTLGCRILHLLPVSPAPTTFARFGRFGSPYALQHLTGIDPALVEFDKRTTGVDQFRELAYAVHARGARLMLDLVINHTGWGSIEWEEHPEWFVRKHDGEFESPGAWDVVWEDLVELDQRHVALWDYLADVFLTWCRRGVDGFRCDAGYKIPPHVWQFITAKVRREFPDTLFLLEGLGGSWEATDACLSEGGMQWAYSELFQNHGPHSIGGYLDHHLRASASSGTLIHYSETHDNSRLAANGGVPGEPVTPNGRRWTLFRNRLCALTSIGGGFGFTCGVEWCATEQINVHSSRGLSWGSAENIVGDLSLLNRLLADHPCFFDGALLTRLSTPGSPVYALRRDSAEGMDSCLVLVNTDFDEARNFHLSTEIWKELGSPTVDLVCVDCGPVVWEPFAQPGDSGSEPVVRITLAPGAVHCLARSAKPAGLSGDAYRETRSRADWGYACWGMVNTAASLPPDEWREVAKQIFDDPAGFLATAGCGPGGTTGCSENYRPVVEWHAADRSRITLVPPAHWLLLRDSRPFRAKLDMAGTSPSRNVESIPVQGAYIAAFAPSDVTGDATLKLERYDVADRSLSASVRFLPAAPSLPVNVASAAGSSLVLLTNGRGAMSRMAVNLGAIRSKYDCLLGANLHSDVPVDRHVFAKRVRAWINADGFISPLDASNLVDFEPGPPSHWRFIANAGDGRSVEIHLVADMLEGDNTTLLSFSRPASSKNDSRFGTPLPSGATVRLVVRVDIEDRNFHWETKQSGGSEYHFSANSRPVTIRKSPPDQQPSFDGFAFTPEPSRSLTVYTTAGEYHQEPEWSRDIPHPVEASRGMEGAGDAFSPGWFEITLAPGAASTVVVTAGTVPVPGDRVEGFVAERLRLLAARDLGDSFATALSRAATAFVVRRGDSRTVIAGYPWFLDWGRDSLIAARGLISAGMFAEVRGLLVTFGRFEEGGTLPNSIYGENASNRDTSDAALWYGIVAEELAAADPGGPESVYSMATGDARGRTVRDVLRSIACGHLAGTHNGIEVDHGSGLVWSPSHFTWMDTNHPAGTPRQGYPVEIQVLWIRLLKHLASLKAEPWEGRGESWGDLARRTEKSFLQYFWLEERGWFSDCLHAAKGHPARMSPPDDALRSNCLLAVALDLVQGEKARRTVDAATRYLVVPGALRSLAPLPVTPPLPLWHHGHLLNDPDNPYWGRYEGDEDTRRKPAYHNGTAWVWTFPAYCEALVKAHGATSQAVAAARAYLGSVDRLMTEGCLGQLPEILDGDTPHAQRGCDAQAWSVTEALRVWRWLVNLTER
jgi:predicted glycogen debranching enzyme